MGLCEMGLCEMGLCEMVYTKWAVTLRMIPCSSNSDIISPNKDCNKESNFNENDLQVQVVSNTR